MRYLDMGVSKNSGTPKSSILIGFSIINHPFWGTPIFGNTHISCLVFFGTAKKRRFPEQKSKFRAGCWPSTFSKKHLSGIPSRCESNIVHQLENPLKPAFPLCLQKKKNVRIPIEFDHPIRCVIFDHRCVFGWIHHPWTRPRHQISKFMS